MGNIGRFARRAYDRRLRADRLYNLDYRPSVALIAFAASATEQERACAAASSFSIASARSIPNFPISNSTARLMIFETSISLVSSWILCWADCEL